MAATNKMHDDSDEGVPLRFMTYNVKRDRTGDRLQWDLKGLDDAKRARITPEVASAWHWDNRVARIARTITTYNPDIVVLNEMRALPTSNYATLYTQEGMGKYRHFESPIDDTAESFINVVLWDPTKWRMEECESISYDGVDSDNVVVPDTGRRFLHTVFTPVMSDRARDELYRMRPIDVYSVHLGMPSHQKWHELKYLNACIGGDIHSLPYVVAGDMNFFFDEDGEKMVRYMRSQHYHDFIGDVPCNDNERQERVVRALYSRSGAPALRSFVPAECDSVYDRKLEDGLLDRVFTGFSLKPAHDKATTVVTDTFRDDADEYEEMKAPAHHYPSDHLAVVCDMVYCPK